MRNRAVIGRPAGLLIAQTLLGLALLVGWLWVVDLTAVGKTLSQARWLLVVLAAALGLISGVLRAFRWRLVLRPIARVPLLDVWLISVASSLINFVIPVRSGELARSLFLKQRHKVSIAASLPTVAVDRSFDLAAVLIVGAAGALSGIRLDGRLSSVLAAGGVLFLGFAAFVLLAILARQRLLTLAERLLPRKLPAPVRERAVGLLERFVAGFTALGRRPQDLPLLLGLSFICALLEAGLFYCLFASLGTLIAPTIVLTGYALFVLTFLVPGAPGYVGSMEAFGSLVFGALGVGTELAASMVVLFHALNALTLGVSGGLAMWALGLRPGRALSDAFGTSAAPQSAPSAEA